MQNSPASKLKTAVHLPSGRVVERLKRDVFPLSFSARAEEANKRVNKPTVLARGAHTLFVLKISQKLVTAKLSTAVVQQIASGNKRSSDQQFSEHGKKS